MPQIYLRAFLRPIRRICCLCLFVFLTLALVIISKRVDAPQRQEDALRAIEAVNNIVVDGRTIKTSLGTTKYCSHFMRNQACPKPDCMYLHDLGDQEASFTKEEMHQGKHQEYERKLVQSVHASSVQRYETRLLIISLIMMIRFSCNYYYIRVTYIIVYSFYYKFLHMLLYIFILYVLVYNYYVYYDIFFISRYESLAMRCT